MTTSHCFKEVCLKLLKKKKEFQLVYGFITIYFLSQIVMFVVSSESKQPNLSSIEFLQYLLSNTHTHTRYYYYYFVAW